jgi:dihydroorotase
MKLDLLLKNGRVLNPQRKIDYVGDLAVHEGKIVKAEAGQTAEKVVDVSGCLVLPGLIDIHTHLNFLGGATGMPADLANIPHGVTASVDAGSTGVSNYRDLLNRLSDALLKTKIMLNVSASGIIMASQFPESVNPAVWDIGMFDDVFAVFGGQGHRPEASRQQERGQRARQRAH